MIKLLIIAKSIDGGTGSFINNLIELKKINKYLQIRIACMEEPSFREKIPKEVYFYHPKGYYQEHYQTSLSSLLNLIAEIFWIRKNLLKYKPNVVLSVDSHCLILVHLAKFFFFIKVKIIASLHNNIKAVIEYKIPKLFNRTISEIIRFILNRSDQVVCVSKNLSKSIFLIFKLKKKPKTIYLGVRHIYKKKLSANNNSILVMSRLSPQKDVFTVIKAFKQLNKKLPSSQLLIAGDGPQKTYLKNYITKKHLKAIKFLNWVNNINYVFQRSKIFILSSNWEGLPHVLLEAMSYRLPIISTDTPFGPREILDNGKYGILVPMKNPQAMANAMYELLTNKEKYEYYSKKSLERVKYFSQDKMLREYEKVIRKIVR